MCSLGFHSLRILPTGNGVKQGGILSPLLFNDYMDNLSDNDDAWSFRPLGAFL